MMGLARPRKIGYALSQTLAENDACHQVCSGEFCFYNCGEGHGLAQTDSKNWFGDAVHTAEKAASKAGHAVADAASSAAHVIGDAASSAGHAAMDAAADAEEWVADHV